MIFNYLINKGIYYKENIVSGKVQLNQNLKKTKLKTKLKKQRRVKRK